MKKEIVYLVEVQNLQTGSWSFFKPFTSKEGAIAWLNDFTGKYPHQFYRIIKQTTTTKIERKVVK